MTTTEMKVVKGTGQTIAEVAYTVLFAAITFYSLCPDEKDRHLAILRSKVAKVRHWVEVQQTLQEIQDLPEIRSRM